MTHQDVAHVVVDEMISELKELADRIVMIADRYGKYGKTYAKFVSPEKMTEMNAAFASFDAAVKNAIV